MENEARDGVAGVGVSARRQPALANQGGEGAQILLSVSECKTTGRGAGFALRFLSLGFPPPSLVVAPGPLS